MEHLFFLTVTMQEVSCGKDIHLEWSRTQKGISNSLEWGPNGAFALLAYWPQVDQMERCFCAADMLLTDMQGVGRCYGKDGLHSESWKPCEYETRVMDVTWVPWIHCEFKQSFWCFSDTKKKRTWHRLVQKINQWTAKTNKRLHWCSFSTVVSTEREEVVVLWFVLSIIHRLGVAGWTD